MRRIAVAALLVLSFLAGYTPAEAQPHRPKKQVVQAALVPDLRVFASNLGSGGECTTGCLATVFAQIESWQPDAIMLSEVCTHDIATFTARYPGWDYTFRPMIRDNAGCGGAGDHKGEFVASPTPFERTVHLDLPGDFIDNRGQDRDYGSPCADIGNVWVCSVHLVNKFRSDYPDADEIKAGQVRSLANQTDDWSRVVIGGDYNATPYRELVWQAFVNRGYVETDRADNEPTHDTSKIDHIWYHEGNGTGPVAVSGVVVAQPTSSHDLLRGSVEW